MIAIEALNAADHLRLRKAARIRMNGTQYGDPQDLVNDALSQTLLAACGKGGRRWRTHVHFVAHLCMTMRGICGDERRSAARRPHVPYQDEDDEGCSPVEEQLHTPSVEEQCCDEEAQQRLEDLTAAHVQEVRRHFADDADVLAIIDGILTGRTASQVQAISGMTKTGYATAHRRWRRGLTALFARRRRA